MIPENAIPSGSMPPPMKEEGKTASTEPEKQTGGETIEKPILGKFKSAEDVIPAYESLEKDHGRLGSEVGALRKQNEMLLNLVTKQSETGGANQNANQGGNETIPDFDKMLTETASAVEAGDLSIGEGMRKVAEITAQRTATIAKETFSQLDSERNAKAYLEQFQKDHPDYHEALQSGELATIRAQNPMHDNLSAYFAWKAVKTQAQAEQQVKEAFEKGRNETAALAAGSEATRRVLGKSGSEARQMNTTQGIPATEADKIQGMLGVLRSARTG